MKKRTVLLLLPLVVLVQGESYVNKNREINLIEAKLIKNMDELNKADSIQIYGDIVTLKKLDSSDILKKTNFKSSDDPLVTRVDDFLNTKKIQINLPHDGSAADLFGRALGRKKMDINFREIIPDSSEARTKLKKMIFPVLLALKIKALIDLPIIIAIITLIGIKGLGAGLSALIIAGALALKSFVTPPVPYPARISYGIIKPDIYHEHWHRSQEEINQPYQSWEPQFNIDAYPYHNLH